MYLDRNYDISGYFGSLGGYQWSNLVRNLPKLGCNHQFPPWVTQIILPHPQLFMIREGDTYNRHWCKITDMFRGSSYLSHPILCPIQPFFQFKLFTHIDEKSPVPRLRPFILLRWIQKQMTLTLLEFLWIHLLPFSNTFTARCRSRVRHRLPGKFWDWGRGKGGSN